jgi:hypothetical protein
MHQSTYGTPRRFRRCAPISPDERRRGHADQHIRTLREVDEYACGIAEERAVVGQLGGEAAAMAGGGTHSDHTHAGRVRGRPGGGRAIRAGGRDDGDVMSAANEFLGEVGQQPPGRRLGRREELIEQGDVHGGPRRAARIFSATLARTCSM